MYNRSNMIGTNWFSTHKVENSQWEKLDNTLLLWKTVESNV